MGMGSIVTQGWLFNLAYIFQTVCVHFRITLTPSKLELVRDRVFVFWLRWLIDSWTIHQRDSEVSDDYMSVRIVSVYRWESSHNGLHSLTDHSYSYLSARQEVSELNSQLKTVDRSLWISPAARFRFLVVYLILVAPLFSWRNENFLDIDLLHT